MTSFVICSLLFLLVTDDHTLLLSAHHDFVLGPLKVKHRDGLCFGFAGVHGSLIDDVLQICTGEAWSSRRDSFKADILSRYYFLHVMLEDCDSATDIW